MIEIDPNKFLDLLYLPILFLVVFAVHELGHFVVARLQGVRISSIKIGAGRLIKQGITRKNKIPWFLHLWPVSGHVELNAEDMKTVAPWQRLLIILAGPAFNIIFPFFILLPLYFAGGKAAIIPEVGSLTVGKPAYEKGLQIGDRIIAVDGIRIQDWNELVVKTWPLPITPVDITVQRNNQTRNITLVPLLREYRNRDGLLQKHGQIGARAAQVPYRLKDIRSIAGQDVSHIRDMERLRDILKRYDEQTITLGIRHKDDQIHKVLTRIDESYNPDWENPGHPDHDLLFISPHRDSYFVPLSLAESAKTAWHITAKKIKAVATLPFQLFPLDKNELSFQSILIGEKNWYKNQVYEFAFRLVLLSIVIGFINLLPLPRLDGSYLLYEIAELIKKDVLSRKEQARILVTAFLLFYLSVFAANFLNMPHYFDKKIQAAQEWLEIRDATPSPLE